MFVKSVFALSAGAVLACAANWTTFGADPERTGWARDESVLSRENVGHMKLLWSKKLDNTVRELTGLTAPVVLGNLFTPKGVLDIVIVGGSADKVFALDGDTGAVLWSKEFHTEQKPKQQPDWLCPNALNATPVIDPKTKTAYVIASDGMLYALQVVNGEQVRPPQQFVPPFSKVWSLNLVNGVLYTPVSQGCNGAKSGVYTLDLKQRDAQPNFFQSSTAGAGIWGRAGLAVDSTTGVAYGATGDGPWDPSKGKYSDTVLAVNPAAKLLDYFTPSNFEWITRKDLDMGNCSPVLFKHGDRKLLATGGKEGLLVMLDTASLGGADHRTAIYRTARLTNDEVQFQGQGIWGAFASADDASGTPWLYVPIWGPAAKDAPKFAVQHGEAHDGSIMAFKLAGGARPALSPAWISQNLSAPEPPVVANGVLYVLSTGENVIQVDTAGNLYKTSQRAETKKHAVLYGLDAYTGAELYSSGDTIRDWAHFSGLAVNNGHVYLISHDNTVYAFGLPQ